MSKQKHYPGRLAPLIGAILLFASLLAAGSGFAGTAPISRKDLDKLAHMLKEARSYKTRIQACRALGMLRDPVAMPHILRAMRKDPDQVVRAACAWSLGAINHPGAIQDLAAAEKKDVGMVKKQAKRALNHILSSFPDNLPEGKAASYQISLEGLKDHVTSEKELTKWVQQYFLDRMVKFDNIEPGSEMNIEEDGELPDLPEDCTPTVRFSLSGGVRRIDAPKKRGAGKIKVHVDFTLTLEPVGLEAIKAKGFSGAAEFVGGPKPSDPWADDPLVEAQKEALDKAVDGAFSKMARFLKLKDGK